MHFITKHFTLLFCQTLFSSNVQSIQQLIAVPHTRSVSALLCVLVVSVVIVRFNVHKPAETNGFSVSILFYHISNKLIHECGISFMWQSRETVLVSHTVTFSF